MDLSLSRRSFAQLVGGGAAAATCLQLGRSAAMAAPSSSYRAMVGVFLPGGNDGWNTVIPTDNRYTAYKNTRGPVALSSSSLLPLPGSNYALNSWLAPLVDVWNDGGLGIVLNTGSLYQPLTKAQFNANVDLRPLNLMSHQDEQDHWQGVRVRDANPDGFMGRLTDRTSQSALPSAISFAGSNLAQLGKSTSPLLIGGTIQQYGANLSAADPAVFARNSAMSTFADTTGTGTITATTGSGITSSYSQINQTNAITSPATSNVDKYFVDPKTGAPLGSGVAYQLMLIARTIAMRDTLGQSRQTFFAQQTGSFDTHTSQNDQHQSLHTDLGLALAAFYNAMKGLGLSQNVTAFTMSDFGRVYVGNASGGTDHAWGNNHLVIGGGLRPKSIWGTYPSQVMGGADDMYNDGRFIPTTAIEEYVGAIAKWHGVADSDMSYVFPNWSTWTSNGRGPLAMFQS